MKKVISTVICVVLALLMVVSLLMIVRHYSEEKKASDTYSDMLDFVVTEGADETESTEPAETEGTETTTIPESETKQEQPIAIDFEQLLTQYPDVVGWLYCEGTPINYPVMQSDDNDYYLRRLPDGTYNTAGSLFADYRCGEIGETNNYIIYGHNMKNGTMFSSLTKYKSQSYYDEHPVMYLYTPNGDYRIELIAGFVSKPTGDVYSANQTSEQIDNYCSLSTFRSVVAPCSEDSYITLSTCSYEYENARYVIIGRMAQSYSKNT